MKKRRAMSLMMATAIFCSMVPGAVVEAKSVQPSTQYEQMYTITSPYANVNWKKYGQYKADFHAHSTNSDGGVLLKDTVEDHYSKGYDILAMTDHNYLTESWSKGNNGITAKREKEIEKGKGRNKKGMIDIYQSEEQSLTDHINSFYAEFNNKQGATMASTIQSVQEAGGITHINHPGRYTGGKYGGEKGLGASNDQATIKKYVDLFNAYSSCVGMEIVNKIDNESRCDRILWDNILKETMPQGRFVWGFANDDTHSINATGYSFNMMLMPTLSREETRKAMETGAFYSVSRVSRLDGINASLPNGNDMPGSGNTDTLYLLNQTTPSISNIKVDDEENSITIYGANYKEIEWIADGEVIAKGNTIDLNDYEDEIHSYVRAQLKSSTGIAFTQPFGVEEKAPEKIKVKSVTRINKIADIRLKEKLGKKKNCVLLVSETGEEGSFTPYKKATFVGKDVIITGLSKKKTYYAYVAYVEGKTITKQSKLLRL